MTILGNVNDHRKGQLVQILPTATGNYLSADFPGWGKDLEPHHLQSLAGVAGMRGRVISVNSHGSNPWTRYSLRLSNGGMVIDGIEGRDFVWA